MPRNNNVIRIFGWLLMLLLQTYAIGQQAGGTIQKKDTIQKPFLFDFSRDIQDQLPPLDSLLLLAHQNSPMLEKYAAFNRAQKEKIALAQKSWSSNIQLQGNYSVGNQSLLLSGSASSDLNQLSNGYRFGINLGLPVYEFFTRPNRVRLAKAEAEASEFQLKEAVILLDKEIISTYHQMIASFRQMTTTQALVEKSTVSELLAEKKLYENQIPLADYTRISEIKAAAENRRYESEKLFYDSYYTLQALLGVPVQSLKR
jgi:outer membrane protein TolC